MCGGRVGDLWVCVGDVWVACGRLEWGRCGSLVRVWNVWGTGGWFVGVECMGNVWVTCGCVEEYGGRVGGLWVSGMCGERVGGLWACGMGTCGWLVGVCSVWGTCGWFVGV